MGKTIKRLSFLVFLKRKGERDRMNEIESFIDDSVFALETPTGVPEATRAFAARLLRHAEHRKMMLERYFCTLLARMGAFPCKKLAEFLGF